MSKRQAGQPVRVLIVEDSRAQRELLVRLIEQAGGFAIAGLAGNGREAVAETCRLRPDVVAMDIHLPGIDGYEATRQIMQSCPTPIVMISSSTGDEQRRSVEALAAGALTVVRKPGSLTRTDEAGERVHLIKTLRLMADVLVVTRHPTRRIAPLPHTPAAVAASSRPLVLAIAASTGGPAAVQTVLNGLGHNFPLPILVSQHIARGFVEALADWLRGSVALAVRVARHEEQLLPGTIYLPPDDQHLMIGTRGFVALRRMQASDRYCPSADLLFESVAHAYARRAIGVILTGMGDDGVRGMQSLRSAGGHTLAQDAASCVVYGMPRAAVAAGAAQRSEPLASMAQAVLQYAGASVEHVAER